MILSTIYLFPNAPERITSALASALLCAAVILSIPLGMALVALLVALGPILLQVAGAGLVIAAFAVATYPRPKAVRPC